MANYLVANGCGYIGGRLVEALTQLGHDVFVLDAPKNIQRHGSLGAAGKVLGSLENPQIIDELMSKADACFLLDPASNNDKGFDGYRELKHIQGYTNDVLKAVKFYQTPLIYGSSSKVYGDSADLPFNESSVLCPLSLYADYLCSLERQAQKLTIERGIPTVGLRLFSVYGARRKGELEADDVVSRFIRSIETKSALTIDGDGSQSRDFIYIDDVIQYFIAALNYLGAQPSCFNVCSGRPVTIKHLASLISRFSGKTIPIRYLPSECQSQKAVTGSPDLAQAKLYAGISMNLGAGLISMMSSRSVERNASNVVKPIAWKTAIPMLG